MHPAHLQASGLRYSSYCHNPEALSILFISEKMLAIVPKNTNRERKQQPLSAVGWENCFLCNTRNVHPVSLGSKGELLKHFHAETIKKKIFFSLCFFFPFEFWSIRSQVSVEVSITTVCTMPTSQSKSIPFRTVAS